MSVFTLLRLNGDGEQFPPQIGSYCLFTISPCSTVHITVMYCPTMIWSRLDSRISSSEPFLRRLYWTSQAKSYFKLKCSALELSVCLRRSYGPTLWPCVPRIKAKVWYMCIGISLFPFISRKPLFITKSWLQQLTYKKIGPFKIMLTLKEERCTK